MTPVSWNSLSPTKTKKQIEGDFFLKQIWEVVYALVWKHIVP